MADWATHTLVELHDTGNGRDFRISSVKYSKTESSNNAGPFSEFLESSINGKNIRDCGCGNRDLDLDKDIEEALSTIRKVFQRDNLEGIHYTRVGIISMNMGEYSAEGVTNNNGKLASNPISISGEIKNVIHNLKVKLLIRFLKDYNPMAAVACNHNKPRVEKELSKIIKNNPVSLNLMCDRNKYCAQNFNQKEIQIINVKLTKKISSWMKGSMANHTHGFPQAFFKAPKENKAIETNINRGHFPKKENIPVSHKC